MIAEQNTRVLAEGYPSGGAQGDDGAAVDASETASRTGRLSIESFHHKSAEWEFALSSVDGHLRPLEDQGCV